MTMFYTHIVSANGVARDPEGRDYTSLGEARRDTIKAARSIVAEEVRLGRDRVTLEFRIEDQHHVQVANLPVSANVEGLEPISNVSET